VGTGQRVALALAVGLLAAGAVGANIDNSPHGKGAAAATTSTTAITATTATTAALKPGPSSAAMAAGLLDPTDFGGYYTVEPSVGQALLDSAPCLGGLEPSPVQSGRALTALVGPDLTGLPEMIEVAISFPGSNSTYAFHDLSGALQSCPSLGIAIGGVPMHIALLEQSMAPVGDASALFGGSFTANGLPQSFQVAVVLDGQIVLTVVWIENVNLEPGEAIMGNLASTVQAAIGKLA
jgi:hypothetical protein